MSKISVTTIAGLTSGGDANKVKIEDGDTFEVVNGSQTINRTGNGDLIAFQKGGVDSGSISIETNGTAFDGEASHAGLKMFATQIAPRQNGADIDNTIDLGSATVRFKDIFISGGLKVGGTGSANALDDYEEGTWTPTYDTGFPGGSPEEVVQGAKYVKIGRLVHCILRLQARNDGTSMQLGGLPFVPNCDGGFGTIGHDSHTTRKERIFSGSSWIAWIFSGTSSSLANQYYSITYTTDS